jgi:hypothetical protein
MLAALRHILVNPATGLVGIAVAVALAVALGITSANFRAQAARYETRIEELTRASEKAEAGFRMELASCRAVGQARETPELRVASAGGTSAGARRLLEQQPEGIDACARMESADQAVLSNLKK